MKKKIINMVQQNMKYAAEKIMSTVEKKYYTEKMKYIAEKYAVQCWKILNIVQKKIMNMLQKNMKYCAEKSTKM